MAILKLTHKVRINSEKVVNRKTAENYRFLKVSKRVEQIEHTIQEAKLLQQTTEHITRIIVATLKYCINGEKNNTSSNSSIPLDDSGRVHIDFVDRP